MIDSNTLTHQLVDTGTLRLHVVEKGEGPVVILLHGFPDFWYSWRNQIDALANQGYRVIVPDLRGYNSSDKPTSMMDYRLDSLAKDVVGLIQAIGDGPVRLVGHDWGGIIAWLVANDYPECVEQLVVMNIPHPQKMLAGLKTFSQALRFSYLLFFQLPWLPEKVLSFDRFRFLKWFLKKEGQRSGGFSDEDLERYGVAHSHRGALTAMVNYYRALRFEVRTDLSARLRPILCPVMVLWGEQDSVLLSDFAEPSPQWVPNCEVRRLEDGGHWVHIDCVDEVNDSLVQFFASDVQEVLSLHAC